MHITLCITFIALSGFCYFVDLSFYPELFFRLLSLLSSLWCISILTLCSHPCRFLLSLLQCRSLLSHCRFLLSHLHHRLLFSHSLYRFLSHPLPQLTCLVLLPTIQYLSPLRAQWIFLAELVAIPLLLQCPCQ